MFAYPLLLVPVHCIFTQPQQCGNFRITESRARASFSGGYLYRTGSVDGANGNNPTGRQISNLNFNRRWRANRKPWESNSNMKRIFLILALSATGLLSVSTRVLAQPQQSENFRITKSVLDAGGGVSTSTNFRLVSAFGQPTPVGVSSSTNFVLSAGFLSPEFAVSPLSPITDLVIRRVAGLSTNMQLNWGAVSGATVYTIHRDTNPLFTPGPGNQIGTSPTSTFTDTGAVLLPGVRYYYNVTSGDGNGPTAARDGSHEGKDAPLPTKLAP